MVESSRDQGTLGPEGGGRKRADPPSQVLIALAQGGNHLHPRPAGPPKGDLRAAWATLAEAETLAAKIETGPGSPLGSKLAKLRQELAPMS